MLLNPKALPMDPGSIPSKHIVSELSASLVPGNIYIFLEEVGSHLTSTSGFRMQMYTHTYTHIMQ